MRAAEPVGPEHCRSVVTSSMSASGRLSGLLRRLLAVWPSADATLADGRGRSRPEGDISSCSNDGGNETQSGHCENRDFHN
jgi:hypothetical protein